MREERWLRKTKDPALFLLGLLQGLMKRPGVFIFGICQSVWFQTTPQLYPSLAMWPWEYGQRVV